MLAKPPGCTCPYPKLVARNMNGHALDCPIYIEWAKEFYGENVMEPTQHDKDRDSYEAIRATLTKLRASKPDERSEKARRYAVTITEMEGVLARFHMYVVNDGAGE